MRRRKPEPRHAVLDEDGNVVPCDLMTWARWFELSRQRIIEQDEIEDYWVSTIFLGLNHQYHPHGAPLWFETMVFYAPEYDGQWDRMIREQAGWSERYTTIQEARAGHQLAIEWIKTTKLSRNQTQNRKDGLSRRRISG